ncbi:MAG: N-acetylglucosamine-6-phosphate deacetylase [Clostridia bacterium]|nr:N-acetylglucosamine-6-phosphate deacetylase [Clostridia bacterium]
MILKNAEIFDNEFNRRKADIRIDGEKIAEIGDNLSGGQEVDLSGCVILPGFIDIHIHGCGGADFCDAKEDTLETMSKTLASFGVTSFCPATMTLPYDEIEKAFVCAAEYKGKECGAYIHGINMEGPFLSVERRGAQPAEYIKKPDINEFKRLNGICNISLVSLAPEVEGAVEFAREASKICTVSAAHTVATYEQAKEGFENGITHTTHLLNGMNPISNRNPGPPVAALNAQGTTAELISDGIHIHPEYLALIYSILGEDRSVAVSDSMRASGMGDGEYTLGGQTVYVKNGKATLIDGTIAASTTNVFDEFKNILRFGVPLKQALKSCTINPARAIGVDGVTGSIAEGKNADLLVMANDFTERRAVYVKGRKVSN